MFSLYDGLAVFVTTFIVVISFLIIQHNRQLGAIKDVIIDYKIFIVFFNLFIFGLSIYQDYEILSKIHIFLFSLFCFFNTIVAIRYFNNVLENGLVINFRKIFWKDIRYFKKTNNSLKVVYHINNRNKQIKIKNLNFESSYLHEKLKEYQISIE